MLSDLFSFYTHKRVKPSLTNAEKNLINEDYDESGHMGSGGNPAVFSRLITRYKGDQRACSY